MRVTKKETTKKVQAVWVPGIGLYVRNSLDVVVYLGAGTSKVHSSNSGFSTLEDVVKELGAVPFYEGDTATITF